MTSAIEVRGLRKSYGELEAVAGIDLRVERGQIFALLGPNGAGKTTTVEILEGHRDRDAGEVEVLGFDPAKGGRVFRRHIGIVLQETGVEPYLTVAETIDLYRGYYPAPRPLDEVIEVVDLGDKRDERVRRLSGGQQRRLDVAIGLAGDPDLLFLDEPTTGFDPAARRGAWQMVKNLKSLGKTVFLTTHYMDEAENLADRVAIIVRGRIAAQGSPEELAARDRDARITFTLPVGTHGLPDHLAGETFEDGRHRLATPTPTRVVHELTGWAIERGIELGALRVSGATLEDVYLELTREAQAEAG